MTAPKTSSMIDHCNALRASYGYPAADPADLEWGDDAFDHARCHEFGELWVELGETPERFTASNELIARLIRDGFEDEEDDPTQYVAARWWLDQGGDVGDFLRLRDEIESAIFRAMPWSYRKAVVCGKN